MGLEAGVRCDLLFHAILQDGEVLLLQPGVHPPRFLIEDDDRNGAQISLEANWLTFNPHLMHSRAWGRALMARTTIAMERWMGRTPGAAVAEGYRRSSWTPKGTAFT